MRVKVTGLLVELSILSIGLSFDTRSILSRNTISTSRINFLCHIIADKLESIFISFQYCILLFFTLGYYFILEQMNFLPSPIQFSLQEKYHLPFLSQEKYPIPIIGDYHYKAKNKHGNCSHLPLPYDWSKTIRVQYQMPSNKL